MEQCPNIFFRNNGLDEKVEMIGLIVELSVGRLWEVMFAGKGNSLRR